MSKKQLAALFLCSLVPWTAGNGLVPLLPVYARQLGASSAIAGYYLALSYLAIALGALSAGWVSGRLGRRKMPLIVAGLVNIPVAWLMGQASTIWGLTVLTALLWFFGGLALALIGILTGLSVGEGERGRVFGILSLTGGLGALIGGLGVGWLVGRWGYTGMFRVLTVFVMLSPLCALLLEEKDTTQCLVEHAPDQKSMALGNSFYLLLAASVTVSVACFVVLLVRSLVMSDLGFGPLAISSTGAIGGLLAMPLPVLMGRLSDRRGRKTLLAVGYLAALASLVLLAFSKALWNFWLVLALQGVAMQGSGTLGNALVADLVPRESLGKGLALFAATAWIGGVLGFAVAGYTLQSAGVLFTVMLGGVLVLGAVALLIPVQARSRRLA